jgi:hypothetical protein
MYFKLQKFTSQYLVNQAAEFCVKCAKSYEHLIFEKNFRGLYIGPSLKAEGGYGEGKEGRGREGGRERNSGREGKEEVSPVSV